MELNKHSGSGHSLPPTPWEDQVPRSAFLASPCDGLARCWVCGRCWVSKLEGCQSSDLGGSGPRSHLFAFMGLHIDMKYLEVRLL